jgi:hypothetical protein
MKRGPSVVNLKEEASYAASRIHASRESMLSLVEVSHFPCKQLGVGALPSFLRLLVLFVLVSGLLGVRSSKNTWNLSECSKPSCRRILQRFEL